MIGAAALGVVAFAVPDSHASPLVATCFLAIAVLFARGSISVWRKSTAAAYRLKQTAAAGPLLGVAAFAFSAAEQRGGLMIALVIGSLVYAAFAFAVAARAARSFGSGAPAS